MELTLSPTDRGVISAQNNRINVGINLENWRGLKPAVSEKLLAFHQHCLDEGLNGEAAAAALGFAGDEAAAGQRTVYQVLKGTYEGSYGEIVERIEECLRLIADRGSIKHAAFSETPVSQIIWAALDYATANQSITLIEGESGHGKTIAGKAWKKEHNHGRTVFYEVPPIGGVKEFLRGLAATQGGNRRDSTGEMLDAIVRAFDPNRMLILDQADRLLPKNGRHAEKLEVVHYLHDTCGLPLGLLCTSRLPGEMENNSYQFEQILGRIGMPVVLPKLLQEADYRPIVVQYFPRPSEKLLTICGQLANNEFAHQKGRLRLLRQVMSLATRIASKDKKTPKLDESHFLKALKMRSEMMVRKEAA